MNFSRHSTSGPFLSYVIMRIVTFVLLWISRFWWLAGKGGPLECSSHTLVPSQHLFSFPAKQEKLSLFRPKRHLRSVGQFPSYIWFFLLRDTRHNSSFLWLNWDVVKKSDHTVGTVLNFCQRFFLCFCQWSSMIAWKTFASVLVGAVDGGTFRFPASQRKFLFSAFRAAKIAWSEKVLDTSALRNENLLVSRLGWDTA